MKKNFISLLVGFIFALGLGYGGMTQPQVVKGFLDFFGNWNMSLMGVMIGAIVVHSLFYQLIKRRHSPLFDTKFHLPTKRDIDRRLMTGAALFGLGWGWVGICPGPGIVALMGGSVESVLFVVSMLTGMMTFKWLEPKIQKW